MSKHRLRFTNRGIPFGQLNVVHTRSEFAPQRKNHQTRQIHCEEEVSLKCTHNREETSLLINGLCFFAQLFLFGGAGFDRLNAHSIFSAILYQYFKKVLTKYINLANKSRYTVCHHNFRKPVILIFKQDIQNLLCGLILESRVFVLRLLSISVKQIYCRFDITYN